MKNLRELKDKDLSDWRLRIWYEAHLHFGGPNGPNKILGYFTGEKLAEETVDLNRSSDIHASNHFGGTKKVLVLTQDDLTGFVVDEWGENEGVILDKTDPRRIKAATQLTKNLTAEQKKILGI